MQQPIATTKTITTHFAVVVLNFTYVEGQLDDQGWLPSTIITTIITIIIVYITIPVRAIITVTTYYVHVHQSYQVAPDATTTRNAATTNGYKSTIYHYPNIIMV